MNSLYTLAAVWLAGYVLACAVWPYRRCGRCGGTGKLRSPMGTAWRPCGRCGGDGTQIRVGRQMAEWWNR